MAEFEAKVVELEINDHPNADRLAIASVGGYKSIVGKDSYKTGDLAVYIPEAAVVPEDVIETLGLTGRLAGKDKNRVKAVRLRGTVSQGIIHPLNKGRLTELDLKLGDDVTEILGLVKYEPPVPVHMEGEVYPCSWGTASFDIENLKKYPDIIPEGELVEISEKLHGSFCGISYHHENGWSVFSKGMGAKGLAFKLDAEKNQSNLYVHAFNENFTKLHDLKNEIGDVNEIERIFIFGEVYGRGVQDLHYGKNSPELAIFDIRVDGKWLSPKAVRALCVCSGLGTVPEVFTGRWEPERADLLAKGKTTLVDGKNAHVREGIVIRPFTSQHSVQYDMRMIAKAVSDDYLFRKGGTEYN